ncbi:hypothetical protein BaRGS_00003916 [Batillaria attramentaria]|uniref:BTB domain-containing protein n=1 Tax=Batillaria attramentaria TaxID=370345 RepID=A0ABD0M0S3_9CAEN
MPQSPLMLIDYDISRDQRQVSGDSDKARNRRAETMSTCPSLSESQDVSGWLPTISSALLHFGRLKDQHALKLQDLLYQQTLQNSNFCDVTIHIGDMTVKAHWCVLVVCPYFQSLYDSGMKESKSGELTLHFGNPFAMREAIKFLYTGQVHITFEKVRYLLEVADYLQITNMKQLCSDFLSTMDMNVENCVQIALLSSMYNLDHLYLRSFQYMCGHLPELLVKDDMLQLTKDSVQALIADRTLSYVKRELFFDFIIRWTEHDKTVREESFEDLFTSLDLKAMSPGFLADRVENNQWVLSSEKCKMWFLEAKIQTMAGLSAGSSDTRDVLVLCGGSVQDHHFMASVFMGSGAVDSMYAYIIQEDRWAKLPPLPFVMRKPLAAVDDRGQILVFDSLSITENQMYLMCFNPGTSSWTGTKLKFPAGEEDFRVHSLMVCAGRTLFVISSVRRSRLASLNASCEAASSAAVPLGTVWHVQLWEIERDTGNMSVVSTFFHRNASTEVRASCYQGPENTGVIYVLGHKVHVSNSKSRNKKQTRFFVFDLRTNRKREYHRAQYEPYVYALPDGFLATRPGKVTARFFNFRTKKWLSDKVHSIKLPPTDANRDDYATVSVKDNLYMFGGKRTDTRKATASAVRYSLATQTWTELAEMPVSLMGAAVAFGRLPADIVRCDLECPHCLLSPHRNRTSYDISVRGYNCDDDDEVGNASSFEFDGSDYSDYYDDYYDRSFSDDGWGYPFDYDPDEDLLVF